MTMPYALPGVAPAPTMAQHFSAGYNTGRFPELSPGLQEQGARWSAESLQAGSRPQSVLSQLSPSPVAANLSAPSQQDRLLKNGVVLPNTNNGAAEPTAQTDTYLRLEQGI